jgi:DNA invertase Pin-like site-specific DNA recombinase
LRRQKVRALIFDARRTYERGRRIERRLRLRKGIGGVEYPLTGFPEADLGDPVIERRVLRIRDRIKIVSTNPCCAIGHVSTYTEKVGEMSPRKARKQGCVGCAVALYVNRSIMVLSRCGEQRKEPRMKRRQRVAIYVRVSRDDQLTINQERELRDWCERAGHDVVQVYKDHGVSGTKGRDKRPKFDAMLKVAVRREFDLLAVWSSCRLGRSLPHLVEVLETIRGVNIGLYIHTQALDTTTPAGRAMFGMLAVFSVFEREMIVARTKVGIARARAAGKQIGRTRIEDIRTAKARAMLEAGTGILKTARLAGLGTSTVQRLKAEFGTNDQ